MLNGSEIKKMRDKKESDEKLVSLNKMLLMVDSEETFIDNCILMNVHYAVPFFENHDLRDTFIEKIKEKYERNNFTVKVCAGFNLDLRVLKFIPV